MTTARKYVPSVAEFLKSEAAQKVGQDYAADGPAQYAPDSDNRLALHFSGHYTVREVKALLYDLCAMQKACDEWRGVDSGELD